MKKIATIGLLCLTSLSLAACSSGGKDSASKNSKKDTETSSVKETKKSTTESSKENKDATYKDRTLTAPDGVLKITGFERALDYDGKPMFFVFFDLTNNTDEAQDIQMMYMDFVDVEQNTGATTENLDMAMQDESAHQDLTDMLSKKINPGATIKAAYTYNFADETKPVIFTFTDSMFSLEDPIATEEIAIP